jgi:hypothetical protein
MPRLVAKYDRNHRPRLKNVEIESEFQLEELLKTLHERINDPCVGLVNERGDSLTIAVRKGVALVVFGPGKGNRAPAMSASVAKNPQDGRDAKELFEFLVGGQSTEVPARLCVPLELMIEVATHFYRTGKLPKSVHWVVD